MRALFTTATIAATVIAGASAQACAAGSAYEQKGNWYCQAVTAISYTNFGTPGQYNKVTSFDDDGKCSSMDVDYAGGISPMDEEVNTLTMVHSATPRLTSTSGIMALPRPSFAQAIRLLYTGYVFKDKAYHSLREATCAQA
jgi:hypothetical protein